jgi:serine/threonine-protein phosphatase PPG1
MTNAGTDHRGAGYTFGSGVVHKFLETNNMSHILRAHQLCMEGYSSLFDKHLSTVWSAPNYCYRCGNSASILEVGPGEAMYFNVFEAAPENERDGPSQQAPQNVGGKVRLPRSPHAIRSHESFLATRVLPLVLDKTLPPAVLAPKGEL